MAQTVKVEIPIEAKDNTAGGLNSVNRRLSSLEKSMQKMQSQIDKMDKSHASIDIDANDNATGKLSDIDDAVAKTNGLSANVETQAEDGASGTLSDIEDAVASVNGESATVEATADDAATPVLEDIEDAVSAVNGESATVDARADDGATPVLDDISDEANSLNGMTVEIPVNVIGDGAEELKTLAASAAGIMGASFGIGESITTYADFEAGMSRVEAISGATSAEMEVLTAKARQMGADTKFSAYEATEALNYMAITGWKTQDMLSGIEGIMNLAAASGDDLGTTSGIVTSALTAFGSSASESTHFADVMAQAMANSATDVTSLGEAFKYVGPVAGALNYSIEDTALALGLMANAGVNGSMAGTSLRRALSNLAAPTSSVQEAMDKYGISLTNSDGSMKSLSGVIENIRDGLSGLSEDEQTAAASTMFGSQAMAGMLAIVNQSEENWSKLESAIENADGAAEAMAGTMMDNTAGAFELLSGALDEVKVTLGGRLSPYMKTFANSLADAMPGAIESITGFMDDVDIAVDSLKGKFATLTNSDEWAEASTGSKVNMVWDKLIAEPFTEWMSSTGSHLISNGLGNMVGDALKIIPGGESAGLTSWLSALVLGKGASKVVSGVKGLSSGVTGISSWLTGLGTSGSLLSSLGGALGSFASYIPAIAGVTAAVAGLSVAIDYFNQQSIKNSFEDTFGDIELSKDQITDFAGTLVNTTFTVNVETALGEMNNADTLREEAEAALQSNSALEWKCSVGLVLSEDEQASYSSNIETFIADKKSELESQFTGVTLAIDTVIDDENSTSMIETVSEWLSQDQAELESLSAQLTAAVQSALEDGMIDVNEQGAIHTLEEKINNILSSWNEGKSQTQLDMIKQKYGHLTGTDLTEGTFADIVSEYQSQRETQQAETEALSEQFYDMVNSAYGSGRLTESQAADWKAKWRRGVWQQEGSSLSNALAFETNTMNDTYGAEISKTNANSEKWVAKNIENTQADYNNGYTEGFIDQINAGLLNSQGNGSKALRELYSQMKPDVTAMQGLIDDYREEFGEIPKNLMQAYNEAIETGAAAGDVDAATQKYANQLVESWDDSMIQAFESGTDPLMESLKATNPDLADAISRALTPEGENIEIDDIMAEIKGIEYDESNVQELLTDAEKKAQESIENAGGTITAASDTELEVQLDPEEINVEPGDTLSAIAEAVGMTVQELAEYNGIEDPNVIEAGATIKIPRDQVTVDADSASDAISQAMSELTAEGADFSVTAEGVTVDLSNVEVDSETAMAQIEAALGMETGTLTGADIAVTTGASVTIPADLVNVDTSGIAEATSSTTETTPIETTADANVSAGSVDASTAAAEVEAETQAAMSETFATEGNTDVTLSQTNNSDAIYAEVGNEINGKFAGGFSTSASVAVTLNWHITNPTASISVGTSGGTATATIAGAAASADGRFVDSPLLSWIGEAGPEYVIPVGANKRSRGASLWMQAGEDLGILNHGKIAENADGGYVSNGKEDYLATPFAADNNIWTTGGQQQSSVDTSKSTSEPVSTAVSGGSGDGKVEVNVNLSPSFQIEGGSMDEQKIFEVIKSRVRELADDIGDEIAEQMSRAFSNMPTAEGA